MTHRFASVIPAGARPAAAALLLGGTIVAAGCTAVAGGPDRSTSASALTAGVEQVLPAGVAVSCAAGQQTLVKQAVVNGQVAVQVECVPMAPRAAAVLAQSAPYPAQPTHMWAPAAVPVSTTRAQATPAVYQTVSDDEVVYQPRSQRVERRSGRSWQKSAVIIGSSAGVGAGVGAAIGGKKGALIGAAIGGGGAAIWDQATRR